MGNVRMRAEQINYGASNVKVALDDLDPKDLIALSERMDTIEVWKATVKAEEKTGASVEYTNALALPAVSLSAEIEAIQDLHGYDHPWVGGAGKNKFPNNTDPDNNSSSMIVEKLANGYKLTATSTAQWQNCMWAVADASAYAGKNVSFNALGIYSGGTHLSRVRLEYDDAGGTQVTAVAGDLNQGCVLAIPAGAMGTIIAQLYLSYGQDCAVGDATTFYNIQFEEASSPTTYEPWENICPISGRTSNTISQTDADEQTTTVTIQLGQTVYGGTLNVTTGVLTVTHANIASYNGETIGEPWISSMDEYTQGGTPTTGAQVVYALATPTTIQLTPTQLTMLKGYNRLSSDGGGDITVKAYTGAPWGGDEA